MPLTIIHVHIKTVRYELLSYCAGKLYYDKKMLFLKGKEFKSIYPQSKVDQNLSFSIKNKNMINNGKTKYKCIKD